MKTFDDLEFREHHIATGLKSINHLMHKDIYSKYKDAKQAIIKFDNEKVLSVLLGEMFYSNGIDTYEAMDLSEDEPKGYLTKEEVTEYMKELQYDKIHE